MENSNQHQQLPIPTEDDILAFIIAIKSGQPPLYFSVINTNQQLGLQISKALIQNGANPKFKDANQQTAIFYCCRDGKKQLLQFMLQCGVGLQEQDLYGQTPIFYAASQNRLNLLDFFTPQSIYNNNLVVNHVDKLAKQTALFYAARKGNLQMCKALIQKGCDINVIDIYNKTAIQYARRSKFQQVVDYLSSQLKKQKQLSKSHSHLHNQSSQIDGPNKKKNQKSSLNMTKNVYKISFLNQNGQVHDLTEQQVKQLCSKVQNLQTYLSNPNSIPQQLLQQSLQQQWQKSATKIINLCWKLKSAHWFHQPVNPAIFNITDYYDIVTKPMDFGTIKKKLSYNAYSRPQQFVDDVKQVFKNTYLYNGQHHDISLCAKQVQSSFEQAIKTQGLSKFLD